MGSGRGWRLTDKRRDKVVELLEKQYDIKSIASHFGVSHDTIENRLREESIDWRLVKRRGISKLRRKALEWIDEVDDAKDRVTVAMKYLDKYDKYYDEDTGSQTNTIKSDDDITQKILIELKG